MQQNARFSPTSRLSFFTSDDEKHLPKALIIKKEQFTNFYRDRYPAQGSPPKPANFALTNEKSMLC